MTTPARMGLGVAKDLFNRRDIEVDLGAYLTGDYSGLVRARFDPALGVGLNISF